MTKEKLEETLARVERGGAPKYHQKNAETGKLFARERIAKLVDAGSFVEDAELANTVEPDLPADGVITGTALVGGPSCRDHGERLDREGGLVGTPHRREDPAHPRDRARSPRARCSTWSTPPARASPIRSRCFPAAAARGASSTTRCS